MNKLSEEQIDMIGHQTMKKHYIDTERSKNMPGHLAKAVCGVTFNYHIRFRRSLICSTCETKGKKAFNLTWLRGSNE